MYGPTLPSKERSRQLAPPAADWQSANSSEAKKNSRRLWRSQRRKSSSVPAGAANFPAAVSLPESAQTLAAIALRAAGKSETHFPAASKFAGKPFQQGISDSHSLLEFSERHEVQWEVSTPAHCQQYSNMSANHISMQNIGKRNSWVKQGRTKIHRTVILPFSVSNFSLGLHVDRSTLRFSFPCLSKAVLRVPGGKRPWAEK